MFDDSRPGCLPIRVVDRCVPLEIRLIQQLRLEAHAPVFQRPQAETVERIDGSGIDHPLCLTVQRIPALQIIAVQPYFDPVQQPFHQLRVSLGGDSLIQGVEVIVVKGQPHREPPDDEGRQILTVAAPLLFGIALYELLKDIPPHQRDCLFFQILRFTGDFLPLLGNLCRGLFRRHHAPHSVEGVHVERQAVEFSVVIGHRRVGKPVERRKAVHIVPDLPAVGMEDMCPVDMDLDSLHVFGIDVACDIGTLINDKDLLSGLRRFPGKHRAVQSRADNQIIIHDLSLHGLCFRFLFSKRLQYKSSA